MTDLSNLPRTREILNQGREEGLHLGVQIYVSLNGDVVADTGVGESQPGVSMTSETFNLWLSAGKPLTAFAIARLKEQGRLDYDDPLGTHLPEWNSAGQPAVTLRQLLTHQAGFPNRELGWPELGWDRILEQLVEIPIPKENATSGRSRYVQAATWFLLGEIVIRCRTACDVRIETRNVTNLSGSVELAETVADCPKCRRSFFPSAGGGGIR
ncbi:MAG TPA: serine hydrolase domain-containing protein [Planctomycetaceae bacterium]|nr:serine hydrolase domain-containing protein [Planctomycetaceae bacterium]